MTQESFDKIVEEFKKLHKLKLKAQATLNYPLEKVLELLEYDKEFDPYPWITYYSFINEHYNDYLDYIEDENYEELKKYKII